jgi:hypothetical protein
MTFLAKILRLTSNSYRRYAIWLISGCIVVGVTIRCPGSASWQRAGEDYERKRPVAVTDAISMTTLADEWYWEGGSSSGRVGHFSPDNKSLVVVLRRGILKSNTNQFSALFWRTDQLFDAVPPRVLFTMSSSSNRPGVEQVTWKDDNETLYFLGEIPRNGHQLFSYDIRTHTLNQITHSRRNLISYSFSAHGKELLYSTGDPKTPVFDSKTDREGLLVSTQWLEEIVMGHSREDSETAPAIDLFLQDVDRPAKVRELARNVRVRWTELHPPRLSPDGTHAVLVVIPDKEPANWQAYQNSFGEHYVVINTLTGRMKDLLGSPIGGAVYGTEAVWSSDSKSVVVTHTFLPAAALGGEERRKLSSTTFTVQVGIGDGSVTAVTDEDLELLGWDYGANQLVFRPRDRKGFPARKVRYRKSGGNWTRVDEDAPADNSPEIVLDEGMTTAPQLFAISPSTKDTARLLDLNPQFKALRFAEEKEITWTDREGTKYTGGLYYPLSYVAGRRYPLVIQTHGFNPDRFMIDGPWTTAYAAQPLAAHGIMVLQMYGYPKSDEAKELASYMDSLNTPREADLNMYAIDGAIDYLDTGGLIDINSIGLLGFSRTCWWVKYVLVNSHHHFRAASVTDGADGGYFQYVAVANQSWSRASNEGINGGDPWEGGIESWLRRAPGFAVGKVNTPLRIVAVNPSSALYEWEWFAAMKRLDRPVEMVVLRDGVHILQKPWDRMISQQGTVDWFCFWLKKEEDADPAKVDQYLRWRQMHK